MNHNHAIALPFVLILGACQPATGEATPGTPTSAVADIPTSPPPARATGPAENPLATPPASLTDPCSAERAAAFVGRNADEATRAELAAAVKPTKTIRWVGPGTMTTEDYSETRLNVMLDAGEVIVSARCG